jgi:hypothetical protein
MPKGKNDSQKSTEGKDGASEGKASKATAPAESAPEGGKDPLAAVAQQATDAAEAVKAALAGAVAAALAAAGKYGAAVKRALTNTAERYVESARAVYGAWRTGAAVNVDWTEHAVAGAEVGKLRDKRTKKAFIRALDLEERTGNGFKKLEQMISVGSLLHHAEAVKAPLDVAGIPIPGMQNLPRCWRAEGGHKDKKSRAPSDGLRKLVAELQTGALKAETAAISKRALELNIKVNGGKGKAKKGKAGCGRCSFLGALLTDMVKAVAVADHNGDFDKAVAAVAGAYSRDVKTLAATLGAYADKSGAEASKTAQKHNAENGKGKSKGKGAA